MSNLPAGTITFLFTDIAGSTSLLRRLGAPTYAKVREVHHLLIRSAIRTHHGSEVDTQGDAFFASFPTARDALNAAIAIQVSLAKHPWPESAAPQVRMGIHTGEAIVAGAGYVGVDVHRAARICGLGYGGQILLSHSTASLVQDVMPSPVQLRDLGEHQLKDFKTPERIYQLLIPDLPSTFPDLQSLSVVPNNLPRQLTRFIGRASQIIDVQTFLNRSRLLTLTGPGGAGKTRLAVEAGAGLLQSFGDGVWLAALAPVSDGALVPQTVATALHIREEVGASMSDILIETLKHRRMLLILDNCEHVIGAASELADSLLKRCAGLRILATSREVLGLHGEMVYEVPALSVPESDEEPSMDQLIASEAAELFADRARLHQPSFAITSKNAAALVRICRRLDGIPLAIELAAAKVKVLSLDDIADRLDARFQLLKSGSSRLLLPKDQTLLATMDWSYDLLTAPERTLFRRLSVFAGSFTIEAAEAVCGVSPSTDGVLDLLARLVDKSLVRALDSGGSVRYRLLESVRAYGSTKLQDANETQALGDSHRDWFLATSERADPELRGRNQRYWLALLEAQHDDLRAALEWCRQTGDHERRYRIAAALWWFWFSHAHLSEGRLWLADADRADISISVRAKATFAAAYLAIFQGGYRRAVELGTISLALHRELGLNWGTALSLLLMGFVANLRADHAKATDCASEAFTLFRDVNDSWGMGYSRYIQGLAELYEGHLEGAEDLFQEGLGHFEQIADDGGVAYGLAYRGAVARLKGDGDEAAQKLQRSLDTFRGLGNTWGRAYALGHLGLVAIDAGDHMLAEQLFQESLAIRRKLQDQRGIAQCLVGFGLIASVRGDHEAVDHLNEALQIRQTLGDLRGAAQVLQALAQVAAVRGHAERAARLLGATDAIRKSVGAHLPPIEHAEFVRISEAARSRLGERGFAQALKAGAEMSLDDVIRFAQEPSSLATEGRISQA